MKDKIVKSTRTCMKNILKNNKKYADTRGFTLVELLVYVGLCAFLLVGIVNSMLILTDAYRTVSNARKIERSAITLMDRIIREARRSTGINEGAFDVPNGSVTLEAGSSTSPYITFALVDGRAVVTEDGDTSPLTDSDVVVDSMVFSRYPLYNVQFATSSVLLKVDFTLTSGSSSHAVTSRSFYGSAILRGSYDFRP